MLHIWHISSIQYVLVRNDMYINEHDLLPNFIPRHNVEENAVIVVLRFTITIRASIMDIDHTLRWAWNGPESVIDSFHKHQGIFIVCMIIYDCCKTTLRKYMCSHLSAKMKGFYDRDRHCCWIYTFINMQSWNINTIVVWSILDWFTS